MEKRKQLLIKSFVQAAMNVKKYASLTQSKIVKWIFKCEGLQYWFAPHNAIGLKEKKTADVYITKPIKELFQGTDGGG